MKFSSLGPIVLLLTVSVEARNCKQGLKYCGDTLTNIGDYKGQIKQALIAEGINSDAYYENILFSCLGGPEGLIEFDQTCRTICVDEGDDKSDRCR